MTAELIALLGCTFILFISILLQGFHTDFTQGFKYALSNRDKMPNPETSATLRMSNNVRNHVEGLALLVPLILILDITEAYSSLSEMGAWTYLVSRSAFAVCYVFGIKIIRSLAWFIGIFGLCLILISLFGVMPG